MLCVPPGLELILVFGLRMVGRALVSVCYSGLLHYVL